MIEDKLWVANRAGVLARNALEKLVLVVYYLLDNGFSLRKRTGFKLRVEHMRNPKKNCSRSQQYFTTKISPCHQNRTKVYEMEFSRTIDSEVRKLPTFH